MVSQVLTSGGAGSGSGGSRWITVPPLSEYIYFSLCQTLQLSDDETFVLFVCFYTKSLQTSTAGISKYISSLEYENCIA